QNGKVTAKKRGACYITATAKDGSKKYAKCKITVK
ncbi:MAG: Ig-like domain-containing protein, partial [Ruminococcus sp.]